MIGHSSANSNVELLKENPNIKINLLITLDAKDPYKFGWTDTNIPSNAKNAINYTNYVYIMVLFNWRSSQNHKGR